jgi:hypothetical protein
MSSLVLAVVSLKLGIDRRRRSRISKYRCVGIRNFLPVLLRKTVFYLTSIIEGSLGGVRELTDGCELEPERS